MKFLGHSITHPSYMPVTAWLRHGPFATWLIKAARPKLVVELGSHHGYSYFAFCQAILEEGLQSKCFAVDTWRGDDHAGHYGEEVYQEVIRQNQPYKKFSTLLRKTFADALDDVADGSIELLHIDGRHFYEDVRDDFESWIPKLSQNAIVLFHDTMVMERDFGVWKYWAELSQHETTFNFKYQHGLGVLFRGQDLTQEMSLFRGLTRTEAGCEALHALFFNAGEAQAHERTLLEISSIAMNGEQALKEFLGSIAVKQSVAESDVVRLMPGSASITRYLMESFAENRALVDEMDELRKNIDADLLVSENLELRRELACVRLHAHHVWKEYLTYKLLLSLTKLPFSSVGKRVRARWARSASKRDPQRSLKDLPLLPTSRTKTIAPANALLAMTERDGI